MKYIEIIIPKAKLILTQDEVLQLVKCDVELFKTAIKRGKYFKRSEQQRTREQKKYEQEGTH